LSTLHHNHYEFARLAVDKAKLCPAAADARNPPPRVAIGIARGADLLGWAAKAVGGEYRVGTDLRHFMLNPNEHAEQALLTQLATEELRDAIVYVTLEPCTKRQTGPSCADLLVERGIREIHIANCDPNPDIGALAWKTSFRHGVTVRDFPAELRNEARRDNAAFFDKFVVSSSHSGRAAFDYNVNDGERVLGPAERAFRTCWKNRGVNSIWALDYRRNVSIAKNCTSFEQVDDPGRWFEDSHYTKPVNAGEIVIFRNEHGFALVRVTSVVVQSDGTNAELQFDYILRYLKSTP
jgi:diaminohydroxyphosphoribosylaminopyrimidine deaminase/5-amino-6-(5-phosphoribosylamino)uracil reductase